MTTEAERLGEEIKAAINDLSGGPVYPDLIAAVSRIVALAQGAQEPVAVVGGSFQLLWLGGNSFSEHVGTIFFVSFYPFCFLLSLSVVF